MQRAGIEGIVLLQAIVDTTGWIERGSVRVIQSDNVTFEGAAKRLIERNIFQPGRVRGEPVRVLVQLPVQFRLIRHRL
jgi:protein TonB